MFYYLGAIILPVGIWLLLAWLIRKYRLFNTAYEAGKEIIWKPLNKKQLTGSPIRQVLQSSMCYYKTW